MKIDVYLHFKERNFLWCLPYEHPWIILILGDLSGFGEQMALFIVIHDLYYNRWSWNFLSKGFLEEAMWFILQMQKEPEGNMTCPRPHRGLEEKLEIDSPASCPLHPTKRPRGRKNNLGGEIAPPSVLLVALQKDLGHLFIQGSKGRLSDGSIVMKTHKAHLSDHAVKLWCRNRHCCKWDDI